MAKFKLDKESIQGFFFHHTEKLVLGVVLVLLVLFIYVGSGIAGLESSKTPANLSQQVQAAESKITATEADVIAQKEEYAPVENHPQRVVAANNPTVPDPYKLDAPITTTGPQPVVRRTDPEIYAPLRPEATVVTGSLVLKKGTVNPWDKLANMERKTIAAPKKRVKKPKKSKRGGAGGMEEMMMSMGGLDEGDDEGSGMSMMEQMMQSQGGMGGMSMGSGMMGEGGAAGSPGVRADAENFVGYRPKTTTGVVGRAVHLVSVRVLVPYQQQWDEFQARFADSEGYSPMRDTPNYLQFRAERAEVPADPNTPPTWVSITYTEQEQKRMQGFVGFPGEIADPRYLHPKLTMPVPPLMLRDLTPLAVHSDVPVREPKKKQVATVAKETETIDPTALPAIEGAATPGAPGAEVAVGPGAGQGRGMMMGQGGGEGGYAAGMMGSGMAGGGMMGSGGTGSGMMGQGMMGQGMMGQGMMGQGMMGQGMMGGMTAKPVGPEAEFKMVRFFDYIQPGKQYMYRVQVLLEDPNRPRMPQAAPHDSILDQTVRDRLVKVAAAEQAKRGARIYYLLSDWSEPTDPVSVSIESNTYAGGVTQPERMKDLLDPASGKKIGYSVPVEGEPIAKVMAVTWNPTYATDLPAIVSGSRGKLLNLSMAADLIEPVSLVYKTIPDYRLASNELVVDLRGGEVLPEQTVAEGEEPLLSPGEVVMLDADGNLAVLNELDDWEEFHRLAPPPPVVVEEAGTIGGEGLEGMMSEMGEEGEE